MLILKKLILIYKCLFDWFWFLGTKMWKLEMACEGPGDHQTPSDSFWALDGPGH